MAERAAPTDSSGPPMDEVEPLDAGARLGLGLDRGRAARVDRGVGRPGGGEAGQAMASSVFGRPVMASEQAPASFPASHRVVDGTAGQLCRDRRRVAGEGHGVGRVSG